VTAAPAPAAIPAPAGRLAAIKARGKLICGVNPNLLGFSLQNAAGQWVGIDADFCRALAAAVFADASKVEFVPLETNERFEALKSGKIDVLSRNTTWTMGREVEMGLEFAGVLYFDGQGFMTSDERGLVSAQQLAGASVCVEQGTTTADNMAFYFKSHQIDVEIKPFATRAELVKAYLAGTCDAYSGDRSSLFADRAGFDAPEKHAVLPEVISKEPLGPVVLKDDRIWAEIVRWTLAGLVNAEEVGLTKAVAAAPAPPKGEIERLLDGAGHNGEQLGLQRTWLKDAVLASGNYGEMFDTNLGKTSPLGMDRGINALWKRGGILYAPPMW
jgi:general L-amino acid transport system substrate-binding protein